MKEEIARFKYVKNVDIKNKYEDILKKLEIQISSLKETLEKNLKERSYHFVCERI